MKILISTASLDFTGVPSYTITLYKELVKRGHSVLVYCPEPGPMSVLMETCQNFKNVDIPDVMLGQGSKHTRRMRERFSNVPLIFINHGVLPDEEQPPRIPIDWYIAINEQSADLLVRQYVDPNKITIIRDFIDLEAYKSTRPLSEVPKVLFLSNYKKWKTYDLIESACRNLNLEFVAKGSPYGRSRDVAGDINQSDVVISWGRGILEAMACGRAAISFNKLLGDGYMTKEVYMDSRMRNFGGFECRYAFTVEELMGQIAKYTPNVGIINRELMVKYHDSKKGADDILSVITKII